MKDFKNLDEQILEIKNKGIIITDELNVKDILLRCNYYNVINGYKRPFIVSNDPETFASDTQFEEIFSMYNFDRQIREIIFSFILKIENTLRSLIAYYFSEAHGNSNYLVLDNFDTLQLASEKKSTIRKAKIMELISSINSTIASAISKKDYILHYISKYGFVPMWVLVNDLSFGQLSKFYTVMLPAEKIKVAQYWNTILHSDLESYIVTLSSFRNLCAHDDRIYCSKIVNNIPDTEYHELLNIEKNENGNYNHGKHDFFSLLIVFKILLPSDDFSNLFNKVRGRLWSLKSKINSDSYNKVLYLMGIPSNWEELKKL